MQVAKFALVALCLSASAAWAQSTNYESLAIGHTYLADQVAKFDTGNQPQFAIYTGDAIWVSE